MLKSFLINLLVWLVVWGASMNLILAQDWEVSTKMSVFWLTIYFYQTVIEQRLFPIKES